MSRNGKTPDPPEAPAQVPPAPVPTQFLLQCVTDTEGRPWALLTCVTPLGQQTYWLPPGLPGELSAMLAGAQHQLEEGLPRPTGLIVPSVDMEAVRRALDDTP